MTNLRTISITRNLMFLFAVAIILLQIFAFVPVVQAAETNYGRDIERRKLEAAVKCLRDDNNAYIDTDDDLDAGSLNDQYADLFHKKGDDEEIVVGFEIDKTNGVQTCLTVIAEGLRVAGLVSGSHDDSKRYFIERIYGTPFTGEKIDDLQDTDENNLADLAGEVAEILSNYERPNDDLRRRRIVNATAPGGISLVSACFEAKPWSEDQPGDYGSNDADFKVDGVGYFMQRDDMDWKGDFPWISETSPARIGDIDLGFDDRSTARFGAQWKQNNSNDSSDFFPIGFDIGQTQGYKNDAIVDCHFVKKNADWIFKENVTVDESGNIALTDNEGNSIGGSAASGSASEDDNSCESKGGAMGWILCPVTTAVGEGLGLIDEQITKLLIIEGEFYKGGAIEDATSVMRTIAFSLLVPMMLIMVISTALGFDFISAYTVKTALPRMVIAIVFIALSFPLMTFVVDVVQNIGHGVQNLILGSFSDGNIDASTTLNQVMEQNAATTGANIAGLGIGGVILGSAVAGASFTGAIFAVLGILGTAALILLAVFMLLLFRQTIVVLMIIVAPLAILPWIFPGRDKLFSLWNKTFWLMIWFYPAVMAVVAVGKAMAIVLLS